MEQTTTQRSDNSAIAEKQIAFLGLGIMGAAMAINLAKAGCKVVGWNRTLGKQGSRDAVAAGVTVAESVEQAVKDADVIFLCVGDAPDVEAMILGEGGVAEFAKPAALLVDMGTSGPASSTKMAAELEKRQLRFADAPVSGGDVGAKNGTLTIMVGADAADYEECKPFFEIMGKKIFHCGPVGSGQAVKLCNQVLCAVNMTSLCEAFSLAEGLGIDKQLVVDVCSTGAGGSWALANLGPKIIAGDFQPAFMIKHMLKDLRLVDDSLAESQAVLPGTNLSRQQFEKAQKVGGGEQGTQAMYRAYSKK